MTNLISGKEALIALANGEDLQWRDGDFRQWNDVIDELRLGIFNDCEFRIKPRTITINGIEVPACGENYKEGEEVYVLDDCCDERGYIEYSVSGHNFEGLLPKLWWRTEEEIKQVVAALRQVFRGV